MVDSRCSNHVLFLGYIGHSIQVSDSQIHRIDISRPDFLAQNDLPLVTLPVTQNNPPLVIPLQQVPIAVATVAEEEIAFSRLSLDEEIDKFHFEKDDSPKPVAIRAPDAEGETDRQTGVQAPAVVITCLDSTSEEDMASNQKGKGLRELLAGRNKGGTSKEAPKSKVPPSLLPPSPSPLVDLTPDATKAKEVEAKDVDSRVPNVAAKAKETEAEVKDGESKAKDVSTTPLSRKEDPPVLEA
ncbi:hypothetical protein SO802_004848 [Lithocarpus litseifolius]|uniref:Uncharacterized protein n=1 Tax=Lithocarpus litseifolius TaxID=425828 RepID=A0AAW2DK86_9ROSI